ncbi:hypothetical protein DN069_07975 [Streptacidiphilus pinicola]|uniref:Uncharacterized protein n=1 Tax=Streptacidiphilus pinicola TaxID=2219663 RepID=A0A2X0KGI5_9ACTN|nr:hypothetical protein [Streptacidiphilus pinicola]RAG86199.1 hypothetical protein DN069_07975 [Streptacidiphilus pinicola]
MPGIYALIDPDGRLHFRDGDTRAMFMDPDAAQASTVAFTILRAQGTAQGLCGYTEDGLRASGRQPNPVGQALVAAFGSPDPPIHGALAICGTHDVPGDTMIGLCGLSEPQQRLIRSVHAGVRQERGEAGQRP